MEHYNKDFLVAEIAARESFTKGDVEIILNSLREVIQEIVASGDELTFVGLFDIHHTKIDTKDGLFDVKSGEYVKKDKYRLTIKPSVVLKKLFHDGIRKIYPPNEEE
jgi:nucleoid DNA-binding protein